MGAHLLCKQRVVGSSPTTSTITERGWISFGSFLKLPLLSIWLCHLDSVYKENESKVKLPSFLCWRGAIGSVTDL